MKQFAQTYYLLQIHNLLNIDLSYLPARKEGKR